MCGMSEQPERVVSWSEAEAAFNDESYKALPDDVVRQYERVCLNSPSQNPAFRERMRVIAERMREELRERETRRLASAAMPTTGLADSMSDGHTAGIVDGTGDVWDEKRILELVGASVGESLTMEYKRSAALSRDQRQMTEVTKDVSAMANSAGGTLIYGIAEDPTTKQLSLDPVDSSVCNRERLENLASQIHPRIVGLRIFPVQVGASAGRVVYVLEIPQGTTAHQASDFRYYRRYNFVAQPMYDHEVRDVMSRAKHPKLSIKAELVVYGRRNSDGNDGVFVLRITNDSDVFARYVGVAVDAPPRVMGRLAHYKDSSFDDLPGGACYRFGFSNHNGPPLFPRAVLMPLFPFRFVVSMGPQPSPELDHFKVVAFADSMPRQNLVYRPEDILVEKSKVARPLA